MTLTKKEQILKSALYLFANGSYNGTSTSKIAEHAGVSEGLIFRHFGSKRALLDALIEEAHIRIEELIQPILDEGDARMALRMVIELPFSVDPNVDQHKFEYWRLQFKLKWDNDYHFEANANPLMAKLEEVFRDLSYTNPVQEAKLLYHLIDTVSVENLRGSLTDAEGFKAFLLKKYGV